MADVIGDNNDLQNTFLGFPLRNGILNQPGLTSWPSVLYATSPGGLKNHAFLKHCS